MLGSVARALLVVAVISGGGLLAPALHAQDSSSSSPSSGAPEKAAAAPRANLDTPDGRKSALDDLFARLSKSEAGRGNRTLVASIERVWMHSGSDTADLLMSRAADAMKAKNWDLSQQVLDKVIELEPNWAEAWNQRATARFSADDFAGSIEDCAHVLALEPRHFGALAGLGYMFQKMDMKKQALRVFRKALEINPGLDDVRKIVDKLGPEIDGQNI